jgi:hypothetical protein
VIGYWKLFGAWKIDYWCLIIGIYLVIVIWSLVIVLYLELGKLVIVIYLVIGAW